jgi:DNA-binding CsgD family transcriptional regulator
VDGQALLATAEDALGRGAFDEAVSLCEEATAVAEAEGPARFLLGALRLMDERYPEAQQEWETAFRVLRAAGHGRLAARAAVELAELHAAALGHPSAANGWIERARRCLEGEGPCVEWGYVELAIMGCDRLDAVDLLAAAERALAIAEAHGDGDLEARALCDRGLALVGQGRVRDGFACLDAALAAITAGEVTPMAVGLCFCSMLTACDRAGDVARAAEWTTLVRAVYAAMAPRPVVMFTHCRVAYGSVLCAAGRWTEGEALLVEALGPIDAPVLSHRSTTVAHLAGLRLDQGRVEEAADLLAPFAHHVTSCGPLARVHLSRGEVALAAAVLRRGLDELVGDALRRAPLLGLLVDVEVERGDLDAARDAAAALADLAATVDLPSLRVLAGRAEARVLVALGDPIAALGVLTTTLSGRADDPSALLAEVRLQRAEVRAATGDAPGAIDDARSALAVAHRLGAAPVRDRAAALLRDLGDTGRLRPQQASDVAAALSRREQEVLDLVVQGLTNAQIAERLYISKKTAEHHVGRVLTKLGVRSRAEAAALAVRLAATVDRGGG